MTITPDKVRHNGFSENLGTDVIAVDANGNILGRAPTETAARHANPDAAAFFTGSDFSGMSRTRIAEAAAQPNDALAAVVKQVAAEIFEDYKAPGTNQNTPLAQVKQEGGAILPDGTTLTKEENDERKAAKPEVDGSAFDHDGDGKVGSGRKASRQRKPAGQ